MRILGIVIVLLCLVLTLTTCKKPYNPTVISTNKSYLVVEGVINSGNDSTFITLSHTIKLNAQQHEPESGAQVTVESDHNDIYHLSEVKTGIYSIANLNLPTDRKYRLHIFTSKGEYASDFVENKTTPPIDSIHTQITKSGVQFYVDSHDATTKTRYYRWDYDETWTYFSLIHSQYLYTNHHLVFRNPDSLVDVCYRHARPSNSFYVASSNKLTQDVISHFPVGYVDVSSGKLNHVYSLHLKEYAITADAFTFWENLKKNTEQLGSIFDPQPSTILGNIHAVGNTAEPVIGFVSVSTVTDKRIFFAGRSLPYELPKHVDGNPDTTDCILGVIPVAPAESLDFRLDRTLASGDTLAAVAIISKITFKIIGYSYAPKACIDCRVVGGTNIRPDYWPINL